MLALLVDGAHQDREDGQPLAGARVHARLAMPGGLALVDLLLADGAGRHPLSPAGGVLERPLGQVQVERPNRCQALAVTDPFHGDGRLVAGDGGDGLLPGAQPLLPRGGDLGCQVQAVDAGMVAFEVFPERVPQVRGEAAQAAVVQRRCAFAQIVHQQVTNRSAGQVEPVDELGGTALTGAAQLPQACRRVQGRGSPTGATPGRTRWRAPSGCDGRRISTSSSSRASPTVTSAITPPLAPRMTAARCSVCLPAAAGRCSSRSHTCRNRANPAASRARAMPRTSAPPRGTAATNQAVLGRRTSAQIATVNAAPNGPVRPAGRPPRAATARESRASPRPRCRRRWPASGPASSAPGCSPSQSSNAASPRRRCFWPRRSPATNGARVSRSNTCSRAWLVAGQPAARGARREPSAGRCGHHGRRRAVAHGGDLARRRCPRRRCPARRR